MNWEVIGVAAGVLGLVYTFARNLKSDLNARFDKIDGKFDKIDERFDKIEARFDKVDDRFEKVYDRFEKIDSELKEIRTGLNRMEGAFYSKDCCMLNNSKLDGKKAE